MAEEAAGVLATFKIFLQDRTTLSSDGHLLGDRLIREPLDLVGINATTTACERCGCTSGTKFTIEVEWSDTLSVAKLQSLCSNCLSEVTRNKAFRNYRWCETCESCAWRGAACACVKA